MYRTVKHLKARHSTKHGAAADMHHVDTDVKVFFHDLYIDAVMVAVKIGIGVSIFKAQLLGLAFHETGKEIVMDAAPAYVTSAPAIAGAV